VKHYKPKVIFLRTNKRGRPKSDRPKTDVGTPELIAKRMAASPTDATLSTTPLDVLKARQVISDEAHSAATYFAALRKIVFGKAHPGAIDLTAVSGMPQEFDRADAESKYREACVWMKQQSRASLDAVENLVVHEIWPSWMKTNNYGRHVQGYKRLSLGLGALLSWYKGHQRKAA
jgi:hypothetical protein